MVADGHARNGAARPELIAAIKSVVDSMTHAERSTTTDADLVRQRAQKRIDEAVKSLDYYLKDLRNPYSPKKPFTADQIKQWDALAEKLRAGDIGEEVYIENPSKMRGAMGFTTGTNIRDLNAIYKTVTGRSFMRTDQSSTGQRMYWTVKAIADNQANRDVKEDVTTTIKGRSDYFIESRRIDGYRASDYWSMPEEMGARAFESYIFDKLTEGEKRSDYLVYAVENRYYERMDMKPYPEGEERKRIDVAFDNLFATIEAKETDQGVALGNIAEDGPFAVDKFDAAKFSSAVENIATTGAAVRGELTLGDTPAVLEALGAKAKTVVMPSSVVQKAINPAVRNHDVRLEDLKNLPALLADPVMVFDSTTESGSLVVVIEATDKSGRPVIVAVHLDAKGSGFHSINKIASVYGKDGTQFMNGRMRYHNKNKAPRWLRAVGLQLPEANTIKRLNPSVVTDGDLVKRYSNASAKQGAISPADKAVYSLISEGKSAAEVLKFIAASSRNPFYRQLARLLQKTGINPSLTLDDASGWKFNAGNDKTYAAAYNPKTDTVALFRPSAAERNLLHELMHAATIKALGKKGIAAGQMKALFKHVEKFGALKGMYGMSDVDEFVAEAFSNPKFQAALKKVIAPQLSTRGESSAWNWFVRIVRGILGLPSNRDNALSQALEIGLGVMRENKALRNDVAGDSVMVDGVSRSTTNANGKPIHYTEEGIKNFWRWMNGTNEQRLGKETVQGVNQRGSDRAAERNPLVSKYFFDGRGHPRVFFHGTADSVTSFDFAHGNRLAACRTFPDAPMR